jgi:hypothetical protein
MALHAQIGKFQFSAGQQLKAFMFGRSQFRVGLMFDRGDYMARSREFTGVTGVYCVRFPMRKPRILQSIQNLNL